MNDNFAWWLWWVQMGDEELGQELLRSLADKLYYGVKLHAAESKFLAFALRDICERNKAAQFWTYGIQPHRSLKGEINRKHINTFFAIDQYVREGMDLYEAKSEAVWSLGYYKQGMTEAEEDQAMKELTSDYEQGQKKVKRHESRLNSLMTVELLMTGSWKAGPKVTK